MKTVYMVRHQRGGIDTTHVFDAKPTHEQMAPIIAEFERLHGKRPTKTGEAPWVTIHEAMLLVGEVPKFPAAPRDAAGSIGASGAGGMLITGKGTVGKPA